MQSVLIYRKIGRAVRSQIGDEEEAADPTRRNERATSCSCHSEQREDEEKEEGEEERVSSEISSKEAGSCDLDSPVEDGELGTLYEDEKAERNTQHGVERISTRHSARTALGLTLSGINAQEQDNNEGKNGQVFIVGWSGEDDPLNPHNFSQTKKACIVIGVASITFVVTMASSIDTAAIPQAAEEFGVSEVVESLATANYLFGFGVGALYAGPLSETFGRTYVYVGSLFFFMVWIMASGLAPNIGAQLTFRFLAGLCGSPALTLSGGTVADMYDPLEKTYGFPLYATASFAGPMLGPVIGAYIGPSPLVSWRWTEWITLITGGLVLTIVTLFQPETYAPVLLKWKTQHLCQITGDDRFRAELEISGQTRWKQLAVALARPFVLVKSELIIVLMTLYLSVIFIVLFTFFHGYTFIFADVYGTSQGLTNVLFTAMFIGVLLSLGLVPLVYSWTKKHMARRQAAGKPGIAPETRLWYAMLGGAPALPISLLWMAWTDYPSISIWSSLIASILFGYGFSCIFISASMYIIDSYEIYAASALTFIALVRYISAGGMTVVGIPFYRNLGTHWTLTILGCIAAVMAPIPYVLYIWGWKVRKFSKHAVNKDA